MASKESRSTDASAQNQAVGWWRTGGRTRRGEGVGAGPARTAARSSARCVGRVRRRLFARGICCRRPSIARIAGRGGKRRAVAFRGAARGLRAAGHTPRPARLPRAARGRRAHGRVAAGTAPIAQAASQTIEREHPPATDNVLSTQGASAPALLTRVVLRSIPGASRPETQYGWPSRPIQLKAFLIERDHAWTSSLAC